VENRSNIEMIHSDAVASMTGDARDLTWKAVREIKELIKPGMTEQEAIKLANQYFASQGVRKFWHKTHIRFGSSTVLSFDDAYQESVVLKSEDIFYIDVGPVWGNIEGDCGETFVIGENPDFIKISRDVKTLFAKVREYWRDNSPSGVNIYEYANKLVLQMGYVLHPSYVKGHRLSEFSHFKYTKEGIGHLEFTPSPERWVLEFQICHPSMKFGAFYEDLLC